MPDINSLNSKKSRYIAGGTTEVNGTGTALEWWDRQNFARAADDTYYTVEQKFEGRIDLISALLLGDSNQWWVLAMYNNILDPYAEVVAGNVLVVPSKARLDAILSGGKTGGVASTREIPTTVLPIV